jgi:amino acid transporter
MGWDNGSTLAGEVSRPQRTYPLAVLLAVLLVALTYVVPFAGVAAAGVDPSAWETGSWVDVARQFGGAPLAGVVVAGGMLSAFAMCTALCLSYSRVPLALARDGYLPRALARVHPRTEVPWLAVTTCTAIWVTSLGLSFDRLLGLDIVLYEASLVLEFIALVVLRVREPELPRPFRVPGGLVGAVAVGLAPVGLMGFAVVQTAGARVGPMRALVLAVLVAALGPLAYKVAASKRGSVAVSSATK